MPDLGTCYFAERPEGAFLEVFRNFPAAVPEAEVRSRSLSRIELLEEVALADCTEARARLWGLTAEIHSTPHYEETQAWASAFARSGFQGVRYLLRHDPSQSSAGFALFGPADSISGHTGAVQTGPINPDLLAEIERRFGISVMLSSDPS